MLKSQGDEGTLLPKDIQKALKTALNMCKVDAGICFCYQTCSNKIENVKEFSNWVELCFANDELCVVLDVFTITIIFTHFLCQM